MPRKLTKEDFLAAAQKIHGLRYDYSGVVYLGSRVQVQIVCPEHGIFNQTPADHIHARAGCPACVGNKRLTLEEFLEDGRKIHGSKYDYSRVVITNNTNPVEIICPEHGSFWQAPKQHRKGRGCPRCGGTAKLTKEAWVQRSDQAHQGKYDYSQSQYVNMATEIAIICPKHGVFHQLPSVHVNGHGCPACAKEALGRRLQRDPTEVRKELHLGRPGYAYDTSGYTSNKDKIAITCPNGHEYTQSTSDARRYGCPTCAGRNSMGEQELREFISALGVTVVRSRKIAAPKEIDAWCPEQKVGFEFNGLYWHSDAFADARRRHIDKSNATQASGGRLIHIWSDDWRDRRTAVEHLIRAALGVLPSVGARQCEVRPVSKPEAQTFLSTYHLQGWTPADYLGLWKDGELQACIGMAPQRSARGKGSAGVWELVRYAARVRVSGGGSRLLSAWRSAAPPWTKIVTYCDLAQFTGGLYQAMGFVEAQRYGPDYKVLFAGEDVRRHKSSVQKSKLKTLLGPKFDAAKSEAHLCLENNIFRVYDCGKVRFELHHQ